MEFMHVQGRDFGFRIRLPEDNNLKTSDLEGDLHLVKILGCKTGVIRHVGELTEKY